MFLTKLSALVDHQHVTKKVVWYTTFAIFIIIELLILNIEFLWKFYSMIHEWDFLYRHSIFRHGINNQSVSAATNHIIVSTYYTRTTAYMLSSFCTYID